MELVAHNVEASGRRVQNSMNCRVNLLELHMSIMLDYQGVALQLPIATGGFFYFLFFLMLTWAQD